MAKSVEERAEQVLFKLFECMNGGVRPQVFSPEYTAIIAAAIREDRAEMVSEVETIYKKALERISKSRLHDMNTLHPEGCASLANESLEAARKAKAG